MSSVALSVSTRSGCAPEGACTPNSGTSALQCVAPVVEQPSAQDVVLWIVPPPLQTTSVSPLHEVVFGAHELQTPPLQPAAPQFVIVPGWPASVHATALLPEQ